MKKQLHILVAQMNFWVGDCEGNGQRIIATLQKARDTFNADLVIFPELALTGYPPEDLLLRSDFHALVQKVLAQIIKECRQISAIVGFPHQTTQGLYNAAAVIEDGQLREIYHKHHLPNYGVFDEKRYFIAGEQHCIHDIKGFKMGLMICEDLWHPTLPLAYKKSGAQTLIAINASPFHRQKALDRYQLLRERTTSTNLPIIYVNGIGGQDEIVFDGGSCAMNPTGEIFYQGTFFQEEYTLITLESSSQNAVQILPAKQHAMPSQELLIYQALITGVRDYVKKNGFSGVLVGSSGGIDSALTLCIATAALGNDNVEAILMPSRFTAAMSIEDAEELANNLGIKHHCISIEPIFNAYLESLTEKFKGLPTDLTEENLQSRCRGTLLMAISNKEGKLVLATGNKSEMAVGYATLYGDMCGAFAPLKDVEKTTVYRLAQLINEQSSLIPQRIITRAPTAELAYEQKDEDSLPPYEVLDDILRQYIEEDNSVDAIVASGHNRTIVCDVIKKIKRSEYKRRQAPPGIRVTTRAFGRDRRYPITSGFEKLIK